eukprot:SAG25_NODE_3272_length_1150_cov_1.195052_1_plen_220_part_00
MGVALAGSLTVQAGGNVTFRSGSLTSDISVATGGGLQLEAVLWHGQAQSLSSSESGSLQCFAPYITLSNAWRATTNGGNGPGGKPMGDVALGATCDNQYQPTGDGGDRWYRFEGAGGDALALSSPGLHHCGTNQPGWLSGWDASAGAGAAPPHMFNTAGHYPTAEEGVVEMAACFDSGVTCQSTTPLKVVRCEGFLLWQLQHVPNGCDQAYCTATSGLW